MKNLDKLIELSNKLKARNGNNIVINIQLYENDISTIFTVDHINISHFTSPVYFILNGLRETLYDDLSAIKDSIEYTELIEFCKELDCSIYRGIHISDIVEISVVFK